MSGLNLENPMNFWFVAHQAGREHTALAGLEDLVASNPESGEGARVLLHIGLQAMGRLDGALVQATTLVDKSPRNAGYIVALAGDLLTAGRWTEAWPLWERRLELPCRGTDLLPEATRWRGGPVPPVLTALCDEGDGDGIMMGRYAAPLAQRGCRVTFAAATRLRPLLERVEGVAAVEDRVPFAAALRTQPWAHAMSLPGLLGTTPATVPSPEGYLTVEAPSSRKSEHQDLPDAGLRVGVCWACSQQHVTPWWRSVPIETLSPLLDVPGISWVNLQVGPLNAEGDAAGIVWNPARSLRDYRETAELVSRLDLVITVDTSVAHLTGALGIPVWVMLPVPPDWRWGVATNTSPWYSSSRLFRQRRMGDWGSVVTEITAQLQSIRQ